MDDYRSQRILKSIARCLMAPTEKSVVDILRDSMEPTEPQNAILYWLHTNWEGKQVNSNLENKLKTEVYEGIYIRRQYSMCHISWDKAHGLLIAHAEKNVYIDTSFIREKNACYFDALNERNRKRQEALANTSACTRLQSKLDNFVALRKDLKKYRQEEGKLFDVVSCEIDRVYLEE